MRIEERKTSERSVPADETGVPGTVLMESKKGCCGGSTSGSGGGGGGKQTPLQIGELLQEAVRLCCVGVGGYREKAVVGKVSALTLSEAELSRPRRLLEYFRVFSSRTDDAGGGGVSEAERQDTGGLKQDGIAQQQGSSKGDGVSKAGGFLSRALATTENEWREEGAIVGVGDSLRETAWLAERFPKATLGDLLANRLELSLWTSYWKRGGPGSSG